MFSSKNSFNKKNRESTVSSLIDRVNIYIDIGGKIKVTNSGSDSIRVCCIHLREKTFGKGMNLSPLSPTK